MLFARFVVTRDEADPENPEKPFPVHLEYVRELWDLLVNNNRIVIAKSRQMMVSWVLCLFCVWWARFHANQAVFWQGQKAEDVYEKIAVAGGNTGSGYLGRCQYIEFHLPDFLKQPLKSNEGQIQYQNGSMIRGLAGGANQIRGLVPSVYIGDEFAFQEEQASTYTSIAPLIQKGMKAIFVSTPNGSGNQFSKLFHGRNV